MDNKEVLKDEETIHNKESEFYFGLLLKTALFTIIVGIISNLCKGVFGLPVLEAVATLLFFIAFVCIVLQVMIWIFGSIRGYSLLVKTLITSIIIGGFFMLGYRLFLIVEFRIAGLVSFGVAVITLIIKIFQLIFLRK